MNGKTYAFLDLAALPAVGTALLDPRPAWVFRGDGAGILWANAAGAAFFGNETMGALLERRIGSANPVVKQLARLARLLPTDTPRMEILRFAFGFNLTAIPAACRRINLPDGKSAVLAIASADGPKESLASRADRLADIIAGDDCLVAVLAVDGRIVGASGGFEKFAPASTTIDALADAVRAGSERIAKRSIRVGRNIRPAGVARFDAGSEGYALLIVGPSEEEDAAPQTKAEAVVAKAAVETPAAAVVVAPAPVRQPASQPVAKEESAHQRVQPTVRFLWQTDGEQRITFLSPELGRLVGRDSADIVGNRWSEAAARLGIDSDGALKAALDGKESWSGVTIQWPIADSDIRIATELTAFPLVERGLFAGFRGFGILRPDEVTRDAAVVIHRAPVAAVTEAEIASSQTVEATPEAKSEAGPQPSDDIDDAARKSIEEGIAARAERDLAPVDAPPPVIVPDVASPPADRSNVVRLPGMAQPRPGAPERLTGTEQDAFRRIAEALGAQRTGNKVQAAAEETPQPPALEPPAAPEVTVAVEPAAPAEPDTRLLDRLLIGVVVFRGDKTLFANRSLLDLLGYETAAEFAQAGGNDALFPGGSPNLATSTASGGELSVRRKDGSRLPVEARLQSVAWGEATALLLSLREGSSRSEETGRQDALISELASVESRLGEMEAILDTATDGVLVFDERGRIGNINRSAEALFGIEAADVLGNPFTDLFAEESRKGALDYLDGIASNGVASVLNDGREVIGKVPQGGLIPLFMTLGRVGRTGKFCAVLRDITHWKNAEEELVAARRAAETANAQKSDFLAKISHEIRTPLNAIIGFSEVMMEERFGAIENPRYRDYLRDIHVSGSHLMSLVNDLLDLSKIEAGKLDLAFESVPVNETIQECVALMQPQANRQRIIIRTSLSSGVPNIVADQRSLRQILLNLLSNAVKFTEPGGQVIVSTTIEDSGEVVIRIRDTGVGMSEKDIETALKPFRQLATSGKMRAEGTGLGLPLTKALVEANRAGFAIDSAVNQGTLVKVTFPTTRVLAG